MTDEEIQAEVMLCAKNQPNVYPDEWGQWQPDYRRDQYLVTPPFCAFSEELSVAKKRS